MDEAIGGRTVAGMSFVVRHKGTGQYLQSPRRWTGQVESALHFNSGLRLVQYVERGVPERPEQLEVIVHSPAASPVGPAQP